jgi:protein-S-isoprenylcysteine O-methyltransferase Ste14
VNLKWVGVVAYVVLIFTIGGLVLRQSLFASGLVGIAVQVLSVLLLLWARLTFGRRSFHLAANPTEGGLVTTGPYRFLRHPIYSAFLYFFWAGVLSHISVVNCLLALIATSATAVRIVAEERLLVKRYPEYVAYMARTKRIIPLLF